MRLYLEQVMTLLLVEYQRNITVTKKGPKVTHKDPNTDFCSLCCSMCTAPAGVAGSCLSPSHGAKPLRAVAKH